MTARDPQDRPTGLAGRLASAGRFVGTSGAGRGWEDMLAEFLAAILVWGGIGWLVDRWLGTEPWLLIAGVVLGNSLGIYLLWLRSDADARRDDRGATRGRR